jgi:glyoxylase-like metal-dependent hydrolase (beta-lactamase superfamily II)
MTRSFRPVVLLLLVGLALGVPALAQRDLSGVEIKSEHVAGKVHMLTGAGGNIGVSVGEDGLLIVDDQFAPLVDKIRAALKSLSPGKLEFVLNTHHHGDHTGGNALLGVDSTIVAHQNVRKRLSTEQRARGQVTPPSPPEALPVITFENEVSLHWNGEEIKMVHFPNGHTDGDSVIYFTGSNVIHMGDHFFTGRFPFVDLEGGGNVVGYAENVGKVLAKLPAGVKIIPGHGPLSTPDDLKVFHQMLTESIALVKKAVEGGKSLDDIKAAGMPPQWKEWGSGFINEGVWLELVYRSLPTS